jgi:hypothetical protein
VGAGEEALKEKNKTSQWKGPRVGLGGRRKCLPLLMSLVESSPP